MRDAIEMRTTLSIDDDVLEAARHLADVQHRNIGEVVSELARRGLTPRPASPKIRTGITLLPASSDRRPVTSEIVRQLRDELP
jgi:hypothetical protein